jgi:hypothetical protein
MVEVGNWKMAGVLFWVSERVDGRNRGRSGSLALIFGFSYPCLH